MTRLASACLLGWAVTANAVAAQDVAFPAPPAERRPDEFILPAAPTQFLAPDAGAPAAAPPDAGPPRGFGPAWSLLGSWVPSTGGFSYADFDVSVRIPTYPVFGPPPPTVTPRFGVALFDAPPGVDVPGAAYNLSLGFSWLRPLNERWALLLGFTPGVATDFKNTSGDMWRFSALALALWNCSEQWQFAFGAVATGREDIPVLPAIGAVWSPEPWARLELMFPRPRFAVKVAEHGEKQHWVYLGGQLGGGTWAYQRRDGADDVFSYRDFRLVAGWETGPPRVGLGGMGPATGQRFFVEIGFVFGRRVEFDSGAPDYEPGNGLSLSAGFSF